MCDTLFNQNYLFKSDKMEKVVLAFSGGLDTTVCVKLLEEEYDYEVITACVDVGQPREELEKSQNSAEAAKLAFIQKIKDLGNINSLDRIILNTLIDKIVISNREIVDGEYTQNIIIHFKFSNFSN